MQIPIVTIDGAAATGKGSIASALAKKLNFNYLDSGIYYRALAFVIISKKISFDDLDSLKKEIERLDLVFKNNKIYWQNIQGTVIDITNKIRSEECSKVSSQISKIQEVRQSLLKIQRNALKMPGLIAEGRDMGTVVFPQAKLKFFLTCDINIRAQRRLLQLEKQGGYGNITDILKGLIKRDERDRLRSLSPLKPAKNAIVIDTGKYQLPKLIMQCLAKTKDVYGL